MKTDNNNESGSLVKSVMLAYLILVLHVLLILGLGLLIFFFSGVVQYMLWIFIGGSAIVLFSAWRFYRRMKQEGKNLREMMHSPIFSGREVEVNLMGGLASFRVGKPDRPLLEDNSENIKQLEDPDTMRLRELNELVRLFENNLITLDEYNQAKKHIFRT